MKKFGPSRRKVNSPRNSHCASLPLRYLDWSAWWLDRSFGCAYLHVRGWNPKELRTNDNETWHRVYARGCDNPRVAMQDGVLYWLIDKEKGTNRP